MFRVGAQVRSPKLGLGVASGLRMPQGLQRPCGPSHLHFIRFSRCQHQPLLGSSTARCFSLPIQFTTILSKNKP
jgi:hypothetical protein